MSEQHYQVIDIDDPTKGGLYADFDSIAKAAMPFFVEKEGTAIKFRPARRSDALDGTPWADVNTDSASIHATVGLPGNVLAGIATADFSSAADGVLSVVNRQTGSATKASIQRVTIDNHVVPTDGNIIINFNSPEIVQVACKNNKGIAQIFTMDFLTPDAAGDHHLSYDDIADLNGPVRIYLDNGTGGGPPPVPVGGRLLQVVYVNNDSAITLAAKTLAVVNTDAKFTAVTLPANHAVITLTEVHAGPRALPVNQTAGANATGIAYTVLTQGADGPLAGKTFQLFDVTGSVGVWFQIGARLAPSAAAACNRNIPITITNDDSNATVASAMQVAIDADAQFIASVVSGTTTVLITDATGGPRSNAVDIDSTLGITIAQGGRGFTFNGPFNADISTLNTSFGGYFTIIRRANNDLDFRANNVGPQPAITIDDSDIEFPNVIFGILSLNTGAMATYFAAQLVINPALQYVLLIYELKIGFAGEDLETVFRSTVRVYRTIFDDGVLPPVSSSGASPLLSYVDYVGGGATHLDGYATAGLATPQLIIFLHPADGLCFYVLVAGIDATALPAVVRPADFDLVTNQRVWKSGK